MRLTSLGRMKMTEMMKMGCDDYPDADVFGFPFKTEDSGNRVTFSSGMQREPSEGKTRYDLLIPDTTAEYCMLVRWAELLTRGAEKYEARNWENANSDEEYGRFKESAFRHFMQWYLWGNSLGEDHAAAVFFNIQGAEYVETRMNE